MDFPKLQLLENSDSRLPANSIEQIQYASSHCLVFADLEPFDENSIEKLPAFPVDAFPDKLRKYVQAVSDNVQVPVDMPASIALAVCALCVQGRYTIQPKSGWVEPLNLYIAVIAPPAERKSPTVNAVARAVYEFEKQENERLEPLIKNYCTEHTILSERLNNLMKIAAKPNTAPEDMLKVQELQEELNTYEQQEIKPIRLLADDITPEALSSLMSDNNGRMAVISSEGGIFDTIAGRYTNAPNLDLLLKAFTGDSYRVDRKGRQTEYIDSPCLTICLTFQPSVLSEIATNKAFIGRRFLQRFLYCLPDTMIGKRKYNVPAIPPAVEANYCEMIKALLSDSIAEPYKLLLDDEAFQESEKFFYELETIQSVQLKEYAGELKNGWTGKIHGTTMRIAGILHVVTYGDKAKYKKISQNTMLSAIQIGRYYMKHSLCAFDSLGMIEDERTEQARYVWNKLQSLHALLVTKRDLWQICRGKRSMFSKADDMNPALNELIQRGYICIEIDRRKTRPSELIRINPNA